MANDVERLPLAKARGVLSVTNVYSSDEWARALAKSPNLFTSFTEIKAVLTRIFEGKDAFKRIGKGNLSQVIINRCEGDVRSATSLLQDISESLKNPNLTSDEVKRIDEYIMSRTAILGKQRSSDHFTLNYTSEGGNPDNWITDQQAIQLLEKLEKAYYDFTSAKFNIYQILNAKIVVNCFYISEEIYGQAAPNTGINLNGKLIFAARTALLHVPAHELFHFVQYAYGYGTRFFNVNKWATEGSAEWAGACTESASYTVYSDSSSVNLTTSSPTLDIKSLEYEAFPIWMLLFGQSQSRTYYPILLFWQAYESFGGNCEAAFGSTLSKLTGQYAGVYYFSNCFYLNCFSPDLRGPAWRYKGGAEVLHSSFQLALRYEDFEG